MSGKRTDYLKSALEGLAGSRGEVFFLSETVLASASLERELAQLFPQADSRSWIKFRFFTIADAYWELLRANLGASASDSPRPERHGKQQALQILARLIKEGEYSELPILDESKSQQLSTQELSAFYRELAEILNLLNSIRTYERDNKFLSQIIDAEGNALLGAKRKEQIFLLLEDYRLYQKAQLSFDPAGVIEELSEKILFSSGRLRLPEGIVLNWINEFTPLESLLWQSLDRQTSITALLPETFVRALNEARREEMGLPSSRYFKDSARFFPALKNIQPSAALHEGVEDLLAKAFDAAKVETPELEHLRVWDCKDRREEVEVLGAEIEFLLDSAQAEVGDFHVVAFELPLYQDLIKRKFSSLGITPRIPRGIQLSSTPVGSFLLAFLDKLEQGNALSLLRYHLHPRFNQQKFAESPSATAEEFLNFLDEQGISETVLKPMESASKRSAGKLQAALVQQKNKDELKNFYSAFRSAEEESSKFKNLSADKIALTLRKQFRKLLLPLGIPKTEPESSLSRAQEAACLRELRRAFSEAASLLEERELEDSLKSFLYFLRQQVESANISLPKSEEGVLVTEFLDVRASFNKRVYILGLSSENFPGALKAKGLETEYLALSQALQTLSGPYEAYAILGHVLSYADTLTLSCYRQDLSAQTEPTKARILEFLPRSRGLKKNKASLLQSGEKSPQLKLLEGRLSDSFSAYDGRLSPQLDVLGDEPNYSITELEQIRECPQRYYFAKVLALPQKPRTYNLSLSSALGNCVHACLERFFRQFPDLVETDFRSACREMLEIAREELSRSRFAWDRDLPAKVLRERLLFGLDRAEDETQRGYLKAALCYQRDYIKSRPLYLEQAFGPKHADSFVITDESLRFSLSGKVDRVDGLRTEGGPPHIQAVWDYKTGKVSKDSLQVPFYAAYLGSRFNLPERGGLLNLEKPNRLGLKLDSPSTGAICELLALEKKGKKGKKDQLDSALVEPNVALAVETAKSINRQCRSGNFAQILSTTTCAYCDYKEICYRNEALLERKLAEKKSGEKKQAIVSEPESARAIPSEIVSKSKPEERSWEERRRALLNPLSAEQEQAADISQSIILRAGAGSGKTQVICHRLLRLVLSGVKLEEIVAITFTEKAAAEIKLRLERLIFARLESEEISTSDSERRLLLEAVNSIPTASIGTIHSFAAQIVRMSPELAGLGDFEKVLDGSEAGQIIKAEVKRALLDPELEGAWAISSLLERGLPLSALESELAKLVGQPELSSLAENLNSVSYVDSLCEALEKEREKYLNRGREDLREKLESWLESVLNFFGQSSGAEYSAEQKTAHLELQELVKAALSKAEDLLSEISSLFQAVEERAAFSKRKSKNNPRNFIKELRELLEKQKGVLEVKTLAEEVERQNLLVAGALARFALGIKQEYAKRKAELRAIDFADLIASAKNMLCSSFPAEELKLKQEALKRRLEQGLKYLLLDEFQDTDPEQWAFLSAAFPDKTAGRLFIVGDEQQAIYGFRGGDIRVIEQVTSELEELQRLQLKDNYRSAEALVQYVNTFFKELFESEFDAEGKRLSKTALRFQPMQAKRRAALASEAEGAERVKLCYFQAGAKPIEGEEDEDEADPGFQGEADFVAQLAKEVLEGMTDESSPYYKLSAYPAPQIAILLRKGQQVTKLANALQALGLPFNISHNQGFYELEEILALENLLQVLLRPKDSRALVGVLRSPIFGLSDEELFQLKELLAGDWSNFFKEDFSLLSLPPAQSARDYLQRLLGSIRFERTSVLLERLLDELQLEQHFLAAFREEAFLNMQRLIDALRKRELERDGNLAALLNWLQAERNSGARAPTANEAESPLTIMTIHASKGLEFPFVILPFLSTRQRRQYDFHSGELSLGEEEFELLGIKVEDGQGGDKRVMSFAQRQLFENLQAEEESEAKRVFYVACTRAREFLYFVVKDTKLLESFRKDNAQSDRAKKMRSIREEKNLLKRLSLSLDK